MEPKLQPTIKALRFALRDWKPGDRFHFPEINAGHIAEAADALEANSAENARLRSALEVARDFIDGEPALNDHTCPGVNCARCTRRLDAFTAVNAALAALKEPST